MKQHKALNKPVGGQCRSVILPMILLSMLWLHPAWAVPASREAPPLTYRVAPMHYNRLAVAQSSIIAVRGEDRDCQIESDPHTGDVYILPLTAQPFSVFVTIASGETQLVRLTPTATHVQNIELAPHAAMAKAAPIPPLRAQGADSLHAQARALLKGRLPEGVVLSHVIAHTIKQRRLTLIPTRRYATPTGDWVIYHAKNRSRHGLSLTDWAWLPRRAVAALPVNAQLKKHETTQVAIFWKKPGRQA